MSLETTEILFLHVLATFNHKYGVSNFFNFGHFLSSIFSIRLIHGSNYTRVYTVLNQVFTNYLIVLSDFQFQRCSAFDRRPVEQDEQQQQRRERWERGLKRPDVAAVDQRDFV